MATPSTVPASSDYSIINNSIDTVINGPFRAFWNQLKVDLVNTGSLNSDISYNSFLKTNLQGPYPDGLTSNGTAASGNLYNYFVAPSGPSAGVNSFVGSLYQVLNAYSPSRFNDITKLKVVLTLPDGTMVYDFSKKSKANIVSSDFVTWNTSNAVVTAATITGTNISNIFSSVTGLYTDIGNVINSYTSFNKKLINENHNSRMAILSSILSTNGVGVETKFSTSDTVNEVRVSRRIGSTPDVSIGVLSVSYLAA